MESNPLGTRLAERLKALHMTQKELASRAEVTEAAVSHYIKGDRFPRSTVLAKLATALGTTTDYLMGGPPQDRAEDPGSVPKPSDFSGADGFAAAYHYDREVPRSAGDPQYSEDLEIAAKLITRNLPRMSEEDKLQIVRILLGENEE